MGFVIDVGSGECWAGIVAGVGVMGELGGYKVGDGEVLASVSILVGVIRDVVSSLGVRDRSVSDFGAWCGGVIRR